LFLNFLGDGEAHNFIIHGILISIVALFGLISNAITIYVYSRPQMRTPINCILIGNKGPKFTIAFLIHYLAKRHITVKIILKTDFRFGSLWHHFYIGYVYHKIYAFLACVSYENYLPCDVSYCSYFIHWKYFHDCSSVFWAICIGMSYARSSYQKVRRWRD
jgi:hypothetical protein